MRKMVAFILILAFLFGCATRQTPVAGADIQSGQSEADSGRKPLIDNETAKEWTKGIGLFLLEAGAMLAVDYYACQNCYEYRKWNRGWCGVIDP